MGLFLDSRVAWAKGQFGFFINLNQLHDEDENMCYKKHFLSALFVILTCISFVSCGQTPEDARKELGKMNVKYSKESFFERIKDNDILAVKLFLIAGMNPNTADDDGLKALVNAAINNDATKLKVLINDNAGASPLMRAIAKGNIDMINLLLDKGADVKFSTNHRGFPEIIAKWNNMQPNIKNLLLDRSFSPLSIAIESKNVDVINLLLSRGVVVSSYDIYIASMVGHRDILELLLDKIKWITKPDEYKLCLDGALSRAIISNNADIIQLLIDRGADKNRRIGKHNQPLLSIAIIENKLTSADVLIKNKADINAQDTFGASPLMWAAFINNEEAVKMLVDAGAKTNIKDDKGKTALKVAKEKGNKKIIDLLSNISVLEVSNLTCQYRNNNLIIKFNIDGGKSPYEINRLFSMEKIFHISYSHISQ